MATYLHLHVMANDSACMAYMCIQRIQQGGSLLHGDEH